MLRSVYTLILFFSISVGFTQNLITNGSAEIPGVPTNGVFGWTEVSGDWQTVNQAGGYLPAYAGNMIFFPGQNNSAELYQDVDVSALSNYIDLGNTRFSFSGYTRSWADSQYDLSRIVVEYRDAGNFLLTSFDTGDLASVGTGSTDPERNSAPDGWLLSQDTTTAPLGTRTIRIRLISTKLVGAADNDGYYDNLSLEAICQGGTVSLSNPSPICEGDNNTLNLDFHAGAIQWQRSYNGGPFLNFGAGNDTQTDAPTYSDTAALYRAEVTIGTCTAYSDTIEIELSEVDGGNVTPSSTTVCQNTAMSLTLNGHSDPTIEWQYSTDNISFTAFGSGANPESYTPTNTGNYYFRAEVTDGNGCTDYSDTVTVSVTPQPSGGTLNNSTGAICLGDSLNIGVTGSDTPIQWQESINGGTSWTDIGSGGTSSYFTPTSINTQYRAEIGSGSCLNYSDTLSPTINPAADAGQLTLAPNPICDGDEVGMKIEGYTATSIQWEYFENGATSWTPFGPDDDTVTVSPGIGLSPILYHAIATNGACTDTTASDTLIINSGAVGGTASITDNTICEGESTSLMLNGETGNIEWFISTNGGSSWTSTSLTADSIAVAPSQQATPYQYRANVTSGSCGENSNVVALTVLPNINPGSINSTPVSVSCDGEEVELTLTGEDGGTSIAWQKSIDNGGTWDPLVGTSNTTTDTSSINNPSVFYRAVVSDATCNAFTNEIAHTVNPLPDTGTFIIDTTSICAGNSIQAEVSGHNGTLSWDRKISGGSWTSTGITSNMYTDSPGTTESPVEYRVIHTLGSCTDTTYSPSVTVAPSPMVGSIAPANLVMCEGEEQSLTLNSSTGTINWRESDDGGVSWTDTGTGTDTLNLAVLTSDSYLHKALLTQGSCVDSTSTVMVTVNQGPSNEAIAISDTILCEGDSFSASLNLSVGSIVSWEASLNNGGSWLPGGPPLTQIDFTPPNLGFPVLFRAIKEEGTCRDTTEAIGIQVDPAANAGSLSTTSIVACENDSSHISITGQNGTIDWQYSTDNGGSWTTTNDATDKYHTTSLADGTFDLIAIVTLGNCVDTSATVDVTINPSPEAGVINTTSNTVCEGDSIDLSLNMNTGTITKWEVSTNNGFSWTDVNKPPISPITVSPPYQAFPILYRSISENGTCYDTTNTNIAITVNRSPGLDSISLFESTICNNEFGTVGVDGSFNGNIRWEEYFPDIDFANPTGGAIPVLLVTPDNNETRYFRAIANIGICEDTSNTVTLTTIIPDAGFLFAPSSPQCQNSNISLSQPPSLTGTSTNRWEYSYDNTAWTTFATNTTNATHNPGDTETSVNYRIIADTLGCTDTSNTRIVSLIELFDASTTISGQDTVCVGDEVNYSVPALENASTYIWTSNNGTELFSANGQTLMRFDSAISDTLRVYPLGCSPSTGIEIPLTINPYPVISITPDQIVCAGDTVFLSITETSGLAPSFLTSQWSLNGSPISDTVVTSGTYEVTMSYDQCATTDSSVITFQDVQITSPAVLYAQKDEINTIDAASNGNWSFSWTPPTIFIDPSQLQPEFLAENNFTTRVIATSPELCRDTSYTEVIVVRELEIPNVFTPNGDGDNETWDLLGTELLSTMVLRVYNRWGTMVYENIGEYVPWNGTRNGSPMPVATYYYVIESPDLEEPIQGSVTIIR